MLRKLQQLRTHPVNLLLGEDITHDLNGLMSIVTSLNDGVGPTAQEYASFSLLFKLCMVRVESTLEVRVPVGSKKTVKALHGREALHFKLTAVKQDFADGKNVKVEDMQVFKKFRWLLTPAEQGAVDQILAKALKDHVAFQQSIKDKMVDGESSEALALISQNLNPEHKRAPRVKPSDQVVSAIVPHIIGASSKFEQKTLDKDVKLVAAKNALLTKFFVGAKKGKA